MKETLRQANRKVSMWYAEKPIESWVVSFAVSMILAAVVRSALESRK